MPPKQQPSDDPEVLASQVKQARDDLSKLTVQGELILNTAKADAEVYEKRAKDLKDNIIPDLLRQERELTQKVADLNIAAEAKEQEMIDAQAALTAREQALNLRDQQITTRERQTNIQVRRHLTE